MIGLQGQPGVVALFHGRERSGKRNNSSITARFGNGPCNVMMRTGLNRGGHAGPPLHLATFDKNMLKPSYVQENCC